MYKPEKGEVSDGGRKRMPAAMNNDPVANKQTCLGLKFYSLSLSKETRKRNHLHTGEGRKS